MLTKYKDSQPYWTDIAKYTIVGWVLLVICISFVFNAHHQIEVLERLERESAVRASRQIEVLETFEKKRSPRPYFTQQETDIRNFSKGINVLSVMVQNNDIPAKDVVTQLLVFVESLNPTKAPLHNNSVDNANDIGPHGKLNQNWIMKLAQIKRPMFVVFQIRYVDALNSQEYSQVLYLKSSGVFKDGTFIQQLFHATSDEKTRIEKYMEYRDIPML